MAHDVFISYSTRDKAVSDAICATLEHAGIRCWMAPRDMQPGRSFAGEITRAIQQSKVMVLVFSGNSNKSEQVLREVQLAVTEHLHVIQFRIEDVGLNDDLKYYLSTPHWLDALTPPLERHIGSLTTAIQALLNPGLRPVPAPTESKSPNSSADEAVPHPFLAWVILGVALIALAGSFLLSPPKPQPPPTEAQPEATPNVVTTPTPALPPKIPPSETVVSFAQIDTGSAPPFIVSAAPYLWKAGFFLEKLEPGGSEVVLVNNRGLYEGKAVFPTVSQNFLTQVNTRNEPASFTLRLSTPAQSVSLVRPRLYAYSKSGVTHPAWTARAFDADNNELSSQSEALGRIFDSGARKDEQDITEETYVLRAPGSAPIVAVRFDSDPRLNGKPFAAFSALLIEQLGFVPARD